MFMETYLTYINTNNVCKGMDQGLTNCECCEFSFPGPEYVQTTFWQSMLKRLWTFKATPEVQDPPDMAEFVQVN